MTRPTPSHIDRWLNAEHLRLYSRVPFLYGLLIGGCITALFVLLINIAIPTTPVPPPHHCSSSVTPAPAPRTAPPTRLPFA